MLRTRSEGYKMGLGLAWKRILAHLFFVNDLKLYSSSIEKGKLQLAIVTEFSRDIEMTFGEDKCGYLYFEHRKRKSQGHAIIVNGVTVKEIEERNTYLYLGQDEAVGYDGKLNKDRVTKEYYRRVQKIWSHNCT